MENLNAEEVKKWLEICAEDTPYPDQSQALLEALALIKELTEKVEAYRQELGKVRVDLNNANSDNKRLTEECENYKKIAENQQSLSTERYFEIKRLTEENERWRSECENQSVLWKQHFESIYQTSKETVKAVVKADTVREFAERFKELMGNEYTSCGFCNAEGYWSVQSVKKCIDRIANEILNKNTEE